MMWHYHNLAHMYYYYPITRTTLISHITHSTTSTTPTNPTSQKKVPLFSQLSRRCLSAVSEVLENRIYLPREVSYARDVCA